MRNAHLALHRAKAIGKKQVYFFSSTLDAVAQRRMELNRELRKAINLGQLTLHFQPQICAKTRELHGLEALCRWPHPEQGMIPPAEFVPIAEENGLIIELGTWVLDEACRTARAWLDNKFDFRQISVNLSPIQIRQPNFDRLVSSLLIMHRLPPHLLCLEITESVFINQEADNVRKMLQRLSSLGVILSLDDFGTGYSSLSYLQGLPFQQLKIDRSFVSKADENPRQRKLLAGIVALGQGLGLTLVAEGTETAAEVAMVATLGCDAVQGYHYCKPVSALLIPIEVERIRNSRDVAPVSSLRIAN